MGPKKMAIKILNPDHSAPEQAHQPPNAKRSPLLAICSILFVTCLLIKDIAIGIVNWAALMMLTNASFSDTVEYIILGVNIGIGLSAACLTIATRAA